MTKLTALFIGLAFAATAITVSAQQSPGRGQGGPSKDCPYYGQGGGAGKDCPYYGQGQGAGQQKRYGYGQGRGQGMGKGFRGGPRDGLGPRRDGSGRQCPIKN